MIQVIIRIEISKNFREEFIKIQVEICTEQNARKVPETEFGPFSDALKTFVIVLQLFSGFFRKPLIDFRSTPRNEIQLFFDNIIKLFLERKIIYK